MDEILFLLIIFEIVVVHESNGLWDSNLADPSLNHYVIIKWFVIVDAEQWGRVRVMTLDEVKTNGSELRHVFMNSFKLLMNWSLSDET